LKPRPIGLRAVVFSLFALASLCATQAQQQLSPALRAAVGRWLVINDEGKPGGQVETYLVDGKLFGKVIQSRPGRPHGELCTKCPDDLKNQPIEGLVFLRNFRPQGNVWSGGTVVDPEIGKEYKGKIWNVGQDSLRLRGYVGISLLGRTQTWTRLP
jgi:uncharacterized protein (DUF2147 family)